MNFFRDIFGPKYRVPIFIIGAPRSGTTLLNLHLAQGKSHRYFPECNAISALISTYGKTKYLDDSRLKAYFGSSEEAAEHYAKLVRLSIERLLRDEPKRQYVTLKDPYLTLDARNIFDIAPDAHVFIMYRPPHATVASTARVTGAVDADVLIPFYKAMSSFANKQRHNPRLHVVYYDRLVADPMPRLEAIGRILGYDCSTVKQYPDDLRGSAFSTEKTFKPITAAVTPSNIDMSLDAFSSQVAYFDRMESWFDRKLLKATSIEQ